MLDLATSQPSSIELTRVNTFTVVSSQAVLAIIRLPIMIVLTKGNADMDRKGWKIAD